jgi:D-alanyl-D-alanine carboxypeptidase
MKEKMEKNSRWLLLAAAVIVIHLFIALAIKGCGSTATKSENKTTENTVQSQEKTPGFFERLFGKKEEKKQEPQKKEPEKQSEIQKPIEEKPLVITYRRKSADVPQLGTAFDFSSAEHGDLPDYYAPGSKGAKSGIVVDLQTRKVLWEKNCRLKTGTASMAKLMTILLFMEHLDANENLTLDTVVDVPKGVMRVPRSGVVYLAPGEKFKISDIVKTAAIKSANDSAEMLALLVEPDAKKFPQLMNSKAASIGMTSTRFINAHGLTEKLANGKSDFSTSTALDMVILAERLLEYPVMMEFFSTQQGKLREQKPLIYTNTNRLVNPRYPGVDGMKTGYTRAAGFCLVFSAKRNGKRIMGCVTGFQNKVDRDKFCRKLVDWAYEPDKKTAVPKKTTAAKKQSVKRSKAKSSKKSSRR